MKEKISVINKITSNSVHKHTDKNWDQWIQILNKAGASNLTHKEIVLLLKNKYKLSAWWQQLVTSCYEVYIGRKIPGQNSKGHYQTTVTKVFHVDQKKLWKLIMSDLGVSIWLKPLSPVKILIKNQFECEGEIFGEFRTMLAPKRIRFTWQDSDWPQSTTVQIYLFQQGKNKTGIAFMHEKLKDLRAKNQMHAYWRNVLNELVEVIQPSV